MRNEKAKRLRIAQSKPEVCRAASSQFSRIPHAKQLDEVKDG